MKLLLIIPAYNEEECIENVINNITKNYSQFDYVVVANATGQKIEPLKFVMKTDIILLIYRLTWGWQELFKRK